MKIVKRLLCVMLSVTILCFGVFTSYLSPHKLNNVYAAETVVLTEEIAQLICQFFGSYVYGYGSGGSANSDIDMDDLAKAGHDFLQRCNPKTYPIEDDQVADAVGKIRESNDPIGSLFYNGQSYVFGTEALDEVAGMDFSVIQGGGDDDDPDEESKLKRFAKSGIALTMTGALLVDDIMPLWVNDLMNRVTPPDYKDEKFTSYEDCLNENGTFNYYLYLKIDDTYVFQYDITNYKGYAVIIADLTQDGWIHLYEAGYLPKTYYGTGSYKNIGLGNYGYVTKSVIYNGTTGEWENYRSTNTSGMSTWHAQKYYTISTNIPIFTSSSEACNFLVNGEGEPFNQAHTYPIADWLSDDWTGTLYDPLTGVNTGSEWYTLVRQGLASSAFASNPNGETYRSSIRDFFKNAKENRTEDTAPYVDPALSPIYIPSTLPEVKIDPDKEEAVKPKVADPVSPVIPNPSTGEDVDLTDDMDDIADYVPELADDLSGVVDTFKTKFPFSIPWDIYYILNGLATTPKAPRFELPLKVERLGINETIIVDMSRFQVLSDLSRSIFSMLFMIVLINLSIKVIGSIKEES